MNSQYMLRGAGTRFTKLSPRLRVLPAIICSLLCLTILAGTFLSALSFNSNLALADEIDDGKSKISDAADGYVDTGKDGFWKTMDKYNSDKSVDSTSFGYVVKRLLSTSYLNDTHLGVPASGYARADKNCDVRGTLPGTPLYHNCDVPNIMTEFLQDGLSVLSQSGPQSAEVSKATLDSAWFGLPSNIPAGGAPVSASERSVKYTALELYGYNLKYTSYAGEWDHIKVLTSARTLSNFGFMDSLRLSFDTVLNGVKGGLEAAGSNVATSLSKGDLFGAFGGAFTGWFGGGASSSINTVLDTSDLNVFNTFAWYRVGYGSTLYNARELTDVEVASNAKDQLLASISSTDDTSGGLPGDLLGIQGGPPDPRSDISSCTFIDSTTKKSVTYGNTALAPGPSKDECAQAAKIQSSDSKYIWDVNGTATGQTMAAWKAANAGILATATKYGINCKVDTTESNRAESLATFKACWAPAWDAAAKKVAEANKAKNVDATKLADAIKPENFRKWLAADPSRNFNAPWNRYVCTDLNGKDMTSGTNYVMLYNSSGQVNPECGKVRAPIQNGFFGNGYLDGQQKPGLDTRYAQVDTSFFGTILPMNTMMSELGNVGLALAMFFTRVSNTVINLSFSPILDSLGLNGIIVSLLTKLRESIFFPLVPLMIGVAGLWALITTAKNRSYRQGFISLLLIAATFVLGTFLMLRPKQTLDAVDRIPSMVETAVVGAIFGFGNNTDDQLCTATGTAAAPKGQQLDGKRSMYSPVEGTRSLMCENWRVFAFNPWVYGQWGTDFDHLYAANTSVPTKMTNTNGDLVGYGSVNMGARTTVNNWALYQLQSLSSGTASKIDPGTRSGQVSRDFYRIVDLQMGPNNGAGTDASYVNNWTGKNAGHRMLTGLMGAVSSAFGMVVVVVYSVYKIIISAVTNLMLVIMPLMFLIGLHPTAGRRQLKSYAFSIGGLMVQRVILIVLMSVMFRMLVGFAGASTNPMLSTLACVLIAILFLKIRKPMLNQVFTRVSSRAGRPIGADFMNTPVKFMRQQSVPGSGLVANSAEMLKRTSTAAFAGGVGGFIANGSVKGAFDGAKNSAQYERQIIKRKQRHRGYGVVQTVSSAAEAASKTNKQNMEKNEYYESARSEVFKNRKEYQNYRDDMDAYNELPTRHVDGQKVAVRTDEDGVETVAEKPSLPPLLTDASRSTTRRMSALARAQHRLDRAELKRAPKSSDEVRKNESLASKIDQTQTLGDARREVAFDTIHNSSAASTPVDQTRRDRRLDAKVFRHERRKEALKRKIRRNEDIQYAINDPRKALSNFENSSAADKTHERMSESLDRLREQVEKFRPARKEQSSNLEADKKESDRSD